MIHVEPIYDDPCRSPYMEIHVEPIYYDHVESIYDCLLLGNSTRSNKVWELDKKISFHSI